MDVMKKLQDKHEFDIVILMVTDVLLEGSHLFYVGNYDVMQQAFSVTPKDKHMFLKGVISRKKTDHPHADRTLGLSRTYMAERKMPRQNKSAVAFFILF